MKDAEKDEAGLRLSEEASKTLSEQVEDTAGTGRFTVLMNFNRLS
jgi:hypothetical protein